MEISRTEGRGKARDKARDRSRDRASDDRAVRGAGSSARRTRWIVVALLLANLALAAAWWRAGSPALIDADGTDSSNVGDVEIRRMP